MDGPAWRSWEIVNGQPFLSLEIWYLNGQRHRLNGPSFQSWVIINEQPVIYWEEWMMNGHFHRLDGPAYQYKYIVSRQFAQTTECWYVKGVKIDPEKLRRPVRRIEQWWLSQRARRQRGIEQSLLQGGMTVWPGFMGLLEGY